MHTFYINQLYNLFVNDTEQKIGCRSNLTETFLFTPLLSKRKKSLGQIPGLFSLLS